MSSFRLAPEAARDIEEIWEYIAADSIEAADRVIDEIYQTLERLVHFPHTGHRRWDLTNRPLRFITVRDYLIDQGMVRTSVSSKGFGKTQPVATNETASGRQQNRRVELVISGEIIGKELLVPIAAR